MMCDPKKNNKLRVHDKALIAFQRRANAMLSPFSPIYFSLIRSFEDVGLPSIRAFLWLCGGGLLCSFYLLHTIESLA